MSDTPALDDGDRAASGLTEIPELSEKLHELLGLGQPPILGIKLRVVFVQAARELGERVWLGYGVPDSLSLARAVPKVSWDGTSPEELDRLLDLLRWIADQRIPPFVKEETWKRDTQDAVTAIECHRADLTTMLEGKPAPAPRPRGRGLLNPPFKAGASGPAGTDRAHAPRVGGAAGSAVGADETVILVPVVARMYGAGDQVPPPYRSLEAAHMLTLRVRALTVQGRGRGPRLLTNGKLPEETLAALREVLGVCGKLGITGAPPLRHILFEVNWDAGSAARVIGRSARLGFLLAAASAWSRLSTRPVQMGLLPGVAATGDLEGTAVRPVDAGTLPLKVRACFYSPAAVLCVPAEQQEAALAEVRRLNEHHPNRQLLVRPCEDVRMVWREPFVVAASARPVRRMAGNLLRRVAVSRMSLALVFLGVLLAGGLVLREAVLSANLPVDVVREDDALVAHNRYGRICLRIPIPPGRVSEPNLGPGGVGFIQTVVDVDGDGKNEIAAIRYGGTALPDLMTVFSRQKRVLWERRASLGLTPDQKDKDDLQWFFFAPLSGESPNSGLVTVRKSTRTSLCLVERVDAATGRTTGALRNDGQFEGLYQLDLERDGMPDWVLLGTDNVSDCGVLAVVDPSAMYLPSTGDWTDLPYLLDPVQIGRGVRTVVLFPKDRWCTWERVAALSLTPDAAGAIAVCVSGGAGADVLYILRFKAVGDPTLSGVQFTDAYLKQIRAGLPGSPIESDIAREETRLAGEVRVLGATGLRRLRSEN